MADISCLRRDIIVIGSSAGGVSVLLELARDLPRDLPAAILIVQHIGSYRSLLPELMSQRGRRRAVHPCAHEMLSQDVIFIAPPDHHMQIVDESVFLSKGAKENHARPAIDPLFRSAAIAQGARVIGVILSGRLDDGTSGLQAIKACGGLAVVQHPDDAEERSMPASAIDHVAVDHVVRRNELAGTLARLAGQTVGLQPRVPDALVVEQQLSLGEGNTMQQLDSIGTPSKIVCPECNGVLWEIRDSSPPRFRCHTGHSYTLRTLEHAQALRADESLWTALRALQEREALLRSMVLRRRRAGDDAEATRLEAEAKHIAAHTEQLHQIATAT